jgi:cell division protease FtsH
VVDAEVARLLREAEGRATAALRAHRPVLDRLVALLLSEETVDGAVVYRLAGRPEPASGLARTVAPGRDGIERQPSVAGATAAEDGAIHPLP